MVWINLIMDILAAWALASESPGKNIMQRPPRNPDSFIITPSMFWTIFSTGIIFLSSSVGLLFFLGADGNVSVHDLTIFFTVFVMFQFWNLFNARCFGVSQSVFHNLSSNRKLPLVAGLILLGQFLIVEFGGALFQTVPLSLSEWLLIMAGTVPALSINEIRRLFVEDRHRRPYDNLE